MTLFPFFEDLDNKTFLVVGSGPVARRKIETLSAFDARIVVVSPDADSAALPVWKVLKKKFEDVDLTGGDYSADYVISATDDKELNRHIAELCREEKIPVNIANDPEACTFLFPSVLKRGDLCIGITTGGKAPAFDRYLRFLLEDTIPEDAETVIDELYALKNELKETETPQRERAKILNDYLKERLP